MAEPSAPPAVIRVLVADDQELYRRGLEVVLSTEDDIAMVAEAADGEEAVRRAEEVAPDVVLMDIRMPRVDGIEAARQIKELVPSTRIIMLTVSDEDTHLYDAIKAGANGYLLKDIAIEEVPSSIRRV
ncbi:MAG: response regulator transcription factor, partial [Acidimicrobiales bacterium]|nr:response regulator transcription factor [Acidimicrobiales bacterium]